MSVKITNDALHKAYATTVLQWHVAFAEDAREHTSDELSGVNLEKMDDETRRIFLAAEELMNLETKMRELAKNIMDKHRIDGWNFSIFINSER